MKPKAHDISAVDAIYPYSLFCDSTLSVTLENAKKADTM